MSDLRLVVFDVDGTLVDSQNDILASMNTAFEALNLPVPTRDEVLSIVGLSLNVAIPKLVPDVDRDTHYALEEGYKRAYLYQRQTKGTAQSSPLYPGAREVLEGLNAQAATLLGLATGKSQRGLDKLLDGHGFKDLFVTRQVADHHPSKPHPSMLQTALAETGVAADAAVMVGDTSFDMEMARAAGMASVGVSWGYHSRDALRLADVVIDTFEELPSALQSIWGQNT